MELLYIQLSNSNSINCNAPTRIFKNRILNERLPCINLSKYKIKKKKKKKKKKTMLISQRRKTR